MKKQASQKLVFSKNVVTELQLETLEKINGGTMISLGCTFCVNSSNGPGNSTIIEDYFKRLD